MWRRYGAVQRWCHGREDGALDGVAGGGDLVRHDGGEDRALNGVAGGGDLVRHDRGEDGAGEVKRIA
ncbi:hypothetical protein ACLB2K_066468 [Fragaria x ananassa]